MIRLTGLKGIDPEYRRFARAVAISAGLWLLTFIVFAVLPKPVPVLGVKPRFPDVTIHLEAAPTAARLPAKQRHVAETAFAVPLSPPVAAQVPAAPVPVEPIAQMPKMELAAAPAAAEAIAQASITTANRPAIPANTTSDTQAAGESPIGERTAEPATADEANRPIRVSSLTLLNAAIKRNLKYPPQAKKRGIEGKVELEIAVNAAGALLACELTGPSGSGVLDEAALKLLRGLFPLTETYGDPFRTRVAIEYRLN